MSGGRRPASAAPWCPLLVLNLREPEGELGEGLEAGSTCPDFHNTG